MPQPERTSACARCTLLTILITFLITLSARAHHADAKPKKIVFIAGKKSHGDGLHEYEKDCRLLKHCIETSPNLKGLRCEVHVDGWPKNAKTLDDADLIVIHSDGADHNKERHPFLVGDRLKIIEKQMTRGCGILALHYALFVPNEDAGDKFLEWMGGYFDYQSGPGARRWYSKIKTATTKVTLSSAKHPIGNGVQPFKLKEEYYYNIKFRTGDKRFVPILSTRIPGETKDEIVAWAVQRKDGGRGFAFTGGHFHANWKLENLRRLTLNAIVWCTGIDVPKGGVQSTLPAESRKGANLNEPIRTLIVTGAQHPAHKWEQTTTSIERALGARGDQFKIKVTQDPEYLKTHDLHHFDLVVINYCNWKKPGLSKEAKANFVQYLKNGGGLCIIHFANGAFNYSLPDAKESDWPEWRTKICRRVWDHTKDKSGHDRYDGFRVEISNLKHPITQGMKSYATADELYFRQQGTELIEVLATARSKVTGKDEPMAFVYRYGKARVFQTVLGHDVPAIRNDGTSTLIRRGATWAAGRELAPHVTLNNKQSRLGEGKFGKALNAHAGGIYVKGDKLYSQPPITVECWARLSNKRGFNILVANEEKSSLSHWEIYTYARNGRFSAYLPGAKPSEIVSNVNVCDDEWHYLMMQYQADRVRLYVDGKLVKDQKIQRPLKPSATGYLAIGQLVERKIRCDGMIDDVRISKDVRAINGMPTSALERDKTTIGLFGFDDDDAAIIDPAWTPRVDLNTRYPWMKETDKDWEDPRFQEMDTGPILGATFAVPGQRKQRVYKGLALRLGPNGEAAMIFDTNLLRMACGWTGKYLMHSSRRFGLLNTPKVAGDVQFVTPATPGWQSPSNESPKKASPHVPLPRAWGRYHGVYLHGKRAIVSYDVGGVRVLEHPWIAKTKDTLALARTFEIAPGDKPLSTTVCAIPSEADVRITNQAGSTLLFVHKNQATGISLIDPGTVAKLTVTSSKEIRLTVAARDKTTRFKLVIWNGKPNEAPQFDALLKVTLGPEVLGNWLNGGAQRYPKPFVTKGKLEHAKTESFLVETITMPYDNPHKALMFASGIDFLSKGNLVVCTAHGDVWVVSGIDEKLARITWKRYATGLYQPLGLKVVDDVIYVLERGQLTRLYDKNNDGEADYYECFNNDWSVLGEEHGFTTCLERDSKGNFYFFKTGSHSAFSGGSLLKVSKDGKKMENFCTGFRHPNGLGMGPNDVITGAGQEGNWVPKTRIDAYVKGGFYGDMRAHHRKVPPKTYDNPICWLPREVDSSGGGQVWVPKDQWGPLGGKMLHFSYGHCKMMMVLHERVDGQIQGGVVRFPMQFLAGACRGRFHPRDKHLYLCGLDGWQTAAVKDGCVHRVRHTGKSPLVPVALNVHKNGIRLELTEPLDKKTAENVKRYSVAQWNYRWSGEYGSKDWSVINPKQEGRDPVEVRSVKLLADGRSVFLEIPDVKPVMQMRIRYSIKSKGGKLIEGDVHNTIHRMRPALVLR